MSETNKIIAKNFLRALGAGDVASLKNLVTDDFTLVTPGTAKVSGVQDRDTVLVVAAAFPRIMKSGLEFTFVTLTAEDDRVACELEGRSQLLDGTDYNNVYHLLMFIRDGRLYKMKEYVDTKLADEVLGPYLGK